MALSARAFQVIKTAVIAGTTLTSSLFTLDVWAQAPTAAQALKLLPIQKDVDFDVPGEAEVARCSIKAEKINGQTGWIVRDASGTILRLFLDTNKDNIVDRWTYYKDGVEVYRDIDENFNGKADNHRWLNTAGMRWGIDKNEDGRIDSWRAISPEEVTAELVMAFRDKDEQRFARLLVTPTELKSLGLGPAKSKELSDKLSAATETFRKLMNRQKVVTSKSTWIHFGGTRPGMVPAGSDGSTADLMAYENVLAMIDTEGKDGQLPVGTLVKVGDLWRLIDAPAIAEGAAKVPDSTGFFFAAFNKPLPQGEAAATGANEKLQKLIDDAQKLDSEITAASPDQQPKLNEQRADMLLSIIEEVDSKERVNWVRNYADTISAAAQGGNYAKGIDRLLEMSNRLEKAKDDDELAAYVRFRYLQADYGMSLQQPNPDFAKIQANYLENLEKFATDYPKSPDASDAMLQLGLAQEVAGQDEKAKTWYGKVVGNFPESQPAKKATGAIFRLNSVGKPMLLKAKAVGGEAVDITKLKGKHVLVHYWATWCEPCKVDLAQLKELQAKYGKDGFTLVGVSLDDNQSKLTEYLDRNRLPWPQIYEPGGLDSRLANEMGVLTLPTMILIDDTGKVSNRGIHITELDNELRAKLKP